MLLNYTNSVYGVQFSMHSITSIKMGLKYPVSVRPWAYVFIFPLTPPPIPRSTTPAHLPPLLWQPPAATALHCTHLQQLLGQCQRQHDSPQITFPPCVTRPSSLTLTSTTVPLVMTPSVVYRGEEGFFFTPRMGRQNVALSSGCVTWAFLKRRPCEGRKTKHASA